MAWASVVEGDATKASDYNNLIDALENQLNSSGYFLSQAPATSTSTGVAGTITYDSSYVYVCTATDTWKRVAIATW